MRRAAVAEVQFFLTASITFTVLHRQGGLTLERCARVCPTSSLLKNDINPSTAQLKVPPFAVIYRVRLREPFGGVNAHRRTPCDSGVRATGSHGSRASRHINASEALGRMWRHWSGTSGCVGGNARADWMGGAVRKGVLLRLYAGALPLMGTNTSSWTTPWRHGDLQPYSPTHGGLFPADFPEVHLCLAVRPNASKLECSQ